MNTNTPAGALLDRLMSRLRPEPLDVEAPDYTAAFAPGNVQEFVDDSARAQRDSNLSTLPLQRTTATLENDLTLTVFSAVPCSLLFTGMVKRSDSSTQPIGPGGSGYIVNVIGDYVARSVTFPRGSGVDLLGLSLSALAGGGSPGTGTIPVGSVWAVVQQSRTLASGVTVITNTLVSGPVTRTQPLGWPGSPVQASVNVSYPRNIIPAVPAAGADWTSVVTTGARWLLQTGFFIFTTSATVGNRSLRLRASDAFTGNQKVESISLTPITASISQLVTFGAGYPIATTGVPGDSMLPLPGAGLLLLAGDTFRSFIGGILAGDQCSSIFFTVQESLDP